MAGREEQQAMEGLLRRSFARESDAGACPDAGILAAYFERSLATDETSHYELHFSQCARCREQLAAMARIGEAVGAGDAAAEKSGHRAWLFGWHWLAPAALAMSLLLVWFIRYRVQTRTNAHPWTAPLVSMMKEQPSAPPAANQPAAATGDLAILPPSSSRQATAPPGVKSPIAIPKKVAPSPEGGDAARTETLAKKESDQSEDRAASAGGLGASEYAQARVEHAVGLPANEAKAPPTAAPQPKVAMNSLPLRLTAPGMQSPPEPPPVSTPPKPAETARAASNLDKVEAVSGQASSGAAPNGTAGAATGAATAPAPVVPITTQSVAVTESAASAPVAATSQNPETTSSLTQTVIGGEARVADGGSANSRAAVAKANDAQKTADTKSTGAAAEPVQAAKKKESSGVRFKNMESNTPSAGQMVFGSGYVMIATPDPAVFWRIAPDGLVEHSTDTGATWEGTQISSHEPLLAGAAPERNVCWLVGRDGLILVTRDARRWKQLEPPVRMDIVSVEAKDASSATIKLADGTRYETSDGGKKWHVVQ
jgi:hypothetical protein